MKRIRLLIIIYGLILLIGIAIVHILFNIDSAEVLLYESVDHNRVINELEKNKILNYSIETVIKRKDDTTHLISGNLNQLLNNVTSDKELSLKVNEAYIGKKILSDMNYDPINMQVDTICGKYDVKSIINSSKNIYILNDVIPEHQIDKLQTKQRIIISLANIELERINYLELKENLLSSNIPVKHIIYYRDVRNTLIRLFILLMLLTILIEGYSEIVQNKFSSLKFIKNNNHLSSKVLQLMVNLTFVTIIVIIFRFLMLLFFDFFVHYSFDITSFEKIFDSLQQLILVITHAINWGFSAIVFVVLIYSIIIPIILLITLFGGIIKIIKIIKGEMV
ncbi:MAG: hypothetical protein JEZ08_24735 [Clostridiales bacterium]|nr:hypothetical protein [Clostridiales bacterium]